MSPYAVDYSDDADNQLADLWVIAKDRNAVTRAQHQIDQLLAAALHAGQYLSEGLWKIVLPPLEAFYEIDDAMAQVTVTDFNLVS